MNKRETKYQKTRPLATKNLEQERRKQTPKLEHIIMNQLKKKKRQ